jgi:hypothetical protein
VPEPHNAYANATVYAAHQCVLKEIREPHAHGCALYGLVQLREAAQSLKGVSPGMQAGVSDTLWSMIDLAEMIDATLPKQAKRGPYKKASNAEAPEL